MKELHLKGESDIKVINKENTMFDPDKRIDVKNHSKAESKYDPDKRLIIKSEISKNNGKDVQNTELTQKQIKDIKKETGWSDQIIEHIDNTQQAEIYMKAKLKEKKVSDRLCLCKEIDADYVDPKTGMTNKELMKKGRSPIDAKTGERIELHHMGQNYDSPFAELCENSEHGDGNHHTLHSKTESSWRNDTNLKNQYNNVDKPNHWKAVANEMGA